MSNSSIRIILGRIETAQPHSPIAVFKTDKPNNRALLNSVFANTVLTQKRLAVPDDKFIGVFDCRADLGEVRELLRHYV